MNIAAALHLESIEAQAAKLLACAETHIYFRGEWTGMQGVNDRAIDLSAGQRKGADDTFHFQSSETTAILH